MSRFFNNRIPLQGKAKSLDEFAAKVLGKNNPEKLTKTASADKEVKTATDHDDDCEEYDAGKVEGELASQPEDKSEDKDCYAEGEEKVEKKAKKWNFEKGDDEDKKEDDDDKEDDDKEEKEASSKKNKKTAEKNEDDSDDDGEKKPKKSKGGSDEAPSSGQLDVEPLHQKGESENASHVNDGNKKAKSEGKTKKASEEETKEASATQGRFVKVSKMNSETKGMLSEYYKKYFPPKYVEFLLQEK